MYPLSHEDDGYDARQRDASERGARERESFDDARLVDLEAEQESPFLRGQKRVSVRRGSIPKKTANRLKWVALALAILAVGFTLLYRKSSDLPLPSKEPNGRGRR